MATLKWYFSYMDNDDQILARFVQRFDWDENEFLNPGQPLVETYSTDRAMLAKIYSKIPGPFPELFERLLLSYRWQRADLEYFRLLANPPGSELSGFEAEIFKDDFLSSETLKEGFVQFGFAPSSYDPLCFDTIGKRGNAWAVVILDHEQVLSYSRCTVKQKLALDFRELVLTVTSGKPNKCSDISSQR